MASRHLLGLHPSQEEVLRDRLADRWTIRERPVETWRRVLLDSFDWSLASRGRLWLQEARAGRLVWEGRDARRPVSAEVVGRPRFAADLPDRAPWSDVAQRLGVRRLLEHLVLVERRRRFELLDDEEKVVARATVVAATARLPEGDAVVDVEPWLELEELRGYSDGAEALGVLREGLGGEALGLAPLVGDEFDRAARALGLAPGVDPSKPRVAYDPDENARVAICRGLEALLDVVEANRDGVRRDLDVEFLHDLRVAVRRTRSVLSDLGRVFRARELDRWKHELRWLGRVSGPTRDLDVLLVGWDRLVAELAPESRGRLVELREVAATRRERELDALVEALESERFEALLRGWRAFLREAAAAGRPKVRSVREEVDAALWRRFRRVTKRGGRLHDESLAEDFHRVRIHGKKLRYLLEVFRPLWDDAEVAAAVKALKRFQDHLGEFNDAEVHAALVRKLAESSRLAPTTVLATGELIEILRRKGRRERVRFFGLFEGFVARENVDRYRRLANRESS